MQLPNNVIEAGMPGSRVTGSSVAGGASYVSKPLSIVPAPYNSK
jgi:hypothetical protein